MQVRSIMGQVRPDRQTLLFSATMPRKVESLVRDALSAPIRITVGTAGCATSGHDHACTMLDMPANQQPDKATGNLRS